MRYGIMGSLAALMMKKITLEYLGRSGFEVSRAQIMREYRGIIDRQPEIGGRKNNLIMLQKAKARLGECKHISFIQGDVGKLPLADESCDMVLKLNRLGT